MSQQSQLVPASYDGATKRTVANIRSHRPGPDVDRVHDCYLNPWTLAAYSLSLTRREVKNITGLKGIK